MKDKRTAAERFWSFVDKGPVCWEWTGAIGPTGGYGIFRLDGKNIYAHCFSYILAHGVPRKQTIDHTCGNRRCVNPAHLEDVSMWENNQRSASLSSLNLRKTRCPRGHAYSAIETYSVRGKKKYHRICHKCLADNRREKRHAARLVSRVSGMSTGSESRNQ
jgi:hypothetical protein